MLIYSVSVQENSGLQPDNVFFNTTNDKGIQYNLVNIYSNNIINTVFPVI